MSPEYGFPFRSIQRSGRQEVRTTEVKTGGASGCAIPELIEKFTGIYRGILKLM